MIGLPPRNYCEFSEETGSLNVSLQGTGCASGLKIEAAISRVPLEAVVRPIFQRKLH